MSKEITIKLNEAQIQLVINGLKVSTFYLSDEEKVDVDKLTAHFERLQERMKNTPVAYEGLRVDEPRTLYMHHACKGKGEKLGFIITRPIFEKVDERCEICKKSL